MANATNTADMIGYLRDKMIRRAEETGDLVHPDVVRVSQRLDLYLVQQLYKHSGREQQAHTSPSISPFPLVAGAPIDITSWQIDAKMRKHLKVVGMGSRL